MSAKRSATPLLALLLLITGTAAQAPTRHSCSRSARRSSSGKHAPRSGPRRWLAIKATLGLRVSEEQEYEGVDQGECGLEAYPEFTRGD
ncbi:MAG: hypothetical protein WD078_15590 [Woeseia sp.]